MPHIAAPAHRFAPRVSPNFNRHNAITRARPHAPAISHVQRVTPNTNNAISRADQRRQRHVQSLQQRVQTLQAQHPRGLRAQHLQQRRLQNAQRALGRQQQSLQRNQANRPNLAPRANRMNAQAAARSRFAARFQANRAQAAQFRRAANLAPRRAWHHHWRARFVPWLGPVFWPYVYSDIFDYTFWPDAYDPGYWAYLYDDFVDTVFWAPDVSGVYAYAPAYASPSGHRTRQQVARREAADELCKDPGKGVTAWPFADMERSLRLTGEQRSLLDDLKATADEAAAAFKDSCPQSFAMTPPGRLRGMAQRIDATLQAVTTVRPALTKFYNSLDDEQRARFNSLGPAVGDRSRTANNAPSEQPDKTCGGAKPGLTQFPIERIEDAVRPNEAQQQKLDRLRGATDKAIADLQAQCPDSVALTPVGRLETMQVRLEAVSKAAKTIQPTLDEFYSALDNEQKAQFNTLSAQASR
jgi:hypothetical protein